MSRIDHLLGRVTMYRLATLCLLAVAILAVALATIGVLPYEPLAMLASGLVAVGVAFVVGALAARVVGTRPHRESAVITGLILFLLFWPLLEVRSLFAVALAAAVAAVSKYVVAVRGRHVLNPAAAGALTLALLGPVLGLPGPVWWVASPSLLPVVALGALLILRRTRRMTMALVYVTVGVGLVVARLVGADVPAEDAVRTALGSYPFVFAAGFMLSEPLTLPPRHWQRLAEAVVVALVASIPFHVGPFVSSPELGLVIGNVLAFACGARRALVLEVVGHRRLTPRTHEVTFQAHPPVRFAPGQYLELTVPHAHPDVRGVRRVFSISSAPDVHGRLTIAFTVPETSSSFKRALLAQPVGTRLRATGVGGDFVLPADPAVPVLLVAGGIGVTPFASQLADLTRSGVERDVVVVQALSRGDQPAYADVLRAAGARVLVLAPERPVGLPEGWHHLGTGPLDATHLTEAVPDASARTAYVSGPPEMVTRTRRTLRRHGVRRVRTDAFSGY